MAQAFTCIKSPEEKIKVFNNRVLNICKTNPITSVKMAIARGLPVVTLLSDVSVADEDDIEDGLADSIGQAFTEGTLSCAISEIDISIDDKGSVFSDRAEAHLGKIYDAAGDNVVDMIIENGGLKKKDDQVTEVAYALVVWENGLDFDLSEYDIKVDDDDDADEGDEDAGDDEDDQEDEG